MLVINSLYWIVSYTAFRIVKKDSFLYNGIIFFVIMLPEPTAQNAILGASPGRGY
jgi:hypothetical protein